MPGMVMRPSLMAWGGWEALPEGQEKSGGPPGVVGRPSRRDGSGWESFLVSPEWSEALPKGRD